MMADAELTQGLVTAIAEGLSEVESALDAGASPDAVNASGTTVIAIACLNAFPSDHAYFSDDYVENDDIVKALLRAGANPNPETGLPPLVYSTMLGNAATTKMLLDAGADANAVGDYGWTALHRACSTSSHSSAVCVELLLAAGADSVVNLECQCGGEILYALDLVVKHIEDHPPSRARIERALPLLLRAGAVCPTPYYSTGAPPRYGHAHPYLDRVIAAGGFRRYEQRHINALAATFGPKLGLLPEMARVVVAFYAHCGFY